MASLINVLCYTLFAVLSFKLLQVVFESIKIYISMNHYRRQGFKTHFFPGLGFFHLYLGIFKVNRKKSNTEKIKSMMKETPAPTCIISNFPGATTPILYLCSPDLTKEFYLKEDLFEKDPGGQKFFGEILGFFFQDGHRALQIRGAFNKIFAYEGLA